MFLLATGIVALAEIGDKTQLLAFMLAARFKRPWPILWGIFIATLVNHLFAAAVGQSLTALLSPDVLRWILGLSFLAMAGWMLIPDKLDAEGAQSTARFGVFGATLIAFFLAEMGDKTQVATVALAARASSLWPVVTGTTLGMMLANAPAVFMGEKLAARLSPTRMHRIAALIFAALGIWVLLETRLPGF
jgi:putative Ca2+/H+ antiporter (TMEM165/GDT1 family)